MTPGRDVPVSELGEDGVVDLISSRFAAPPDAVGIGDDAAVFPAPGARLAFTTDTMVEAVDFDLGYFPAADLGWKATAINVSDMAAMAARPATAVATLCIPPETTAGFVADLAEGMAEAAREWGLHVVGGDISAAGAVSIGVALLGTVETPVLRSGARAGDAICVTGAVGGSRGGLELLRRDPEASGYLVERHRRPRARLEEATILASLGATAMIDVSDGCAIDLARLLRASGAGCSVDPGSIPVDPPLSEVGDLDPMQAALFGGEDFELLVTLPESRLEEARQALRPTGTAFTRIGTVTDGDRLLGGDRLDDMKESMWDHLRSR